MSLGGPPPERTTGPLVTSIMRLTLAERKGFTNDRSGRSFLRRASYQATF
jgi:hypothetical protein